MLDDLTMALSQTPRKYGSESEVMLARLLPGGIFELLTGAWSHALGYAPEELEGKSLRELIPLEKPAALVLLAALLDDADAEPLDIPLRCKDERRKCFRFHRRFDAYEASLFVVADDLG